MKADHQKHGKRKPSTNKPVATPPETETQVKIFDQHDLPPPFLFMQGSLVVEIDEPVFDPAPTSGAHKKHHHRKAKKAGMTKVELAHIKVIDGSGEPLYRNLLAEGCKVTFTMDDLSEVVVEGGAPAEGGQTAFQIDTPDTQPLNMATGGDAPLGKKRAGRFRYKQPGTQAPQIRTITVSDGTPPSASNNPTLFRVSPADQDEVRVMVWIHELP